MGRHSKFSFPIPGRKYATKDHEDASSVISTTKSSSAHNNLSKAQRILGTDSDLNIDSPTRDGNHPWNYPGSRASGMSISISESTQSTNENGSFHEYQIDQWDRESGVLPGDSQLHGKASSTLLGQRHCDNGPTSASSLSGRLTSKDSSSTLKSFYDRQKSPLSISQQTSASSARDLALRKGYPPIIPRSPLLQVESALDSVDRQHQIKIGYGPDTDVDNSLDKSRKKPSRLALSMLFPRSKRPVSMTPSPSSAIASASRDTSTNWDTGPRKLKKSDFRESMHSRNHSIGSGLSHDPSLRHNHGTLNHMYDHYEYMPVRSPHMDRIPESGVYESNRPRPHPETPSPVHKAPPKSNRESFGRSIEHQPFSWKNVRASMISQPWESSSAASISSKHTKTSRHTNGSILSNSDLQERSVLSFSSDSEEDEIHEKSIKPHMTAPQINAVKTSDNLRLSARSEEGQQRHVQQHSGGLISGGRSKKSSNLHLEVPPKSSPSPQMSNARTQTRQRDDTNAASYPKTQSRTSHRDKRSSRTSSSLRSEKSSQMQPTPPLSPASESSSRFMAVTKQEEALLEALRQKRARMREEIINEHKIAKHLPPPQIPERHASRASRNLATSSYTTRGSDGRVLLYLDTPVANSQLIDTAEPSSDNLSDFMSYSDEDSTPRTSWKPPKKSHFRPESLVLPQTRIDRFSPMTPPAAARLSAVGGYNNQHSHLKKRNSGVRFVDHPTDDSRLVNAQDFLLDENESEVLWR